jgi:WXG100 family type VII secretion target
MADDTVQVDHDAMKSASKRFNDQSEQVRAQYSKISHQLEVLENGGWEGQNFVKFKEIMEQTLLPAVQRLHKALDTASDTTNQVAKIMHDADEQNKGLFPA